MESNVSTTELSREQLIQFCSENGLDPGTLKRLPDYEIKKMLNSQQQYRQEKGDDITQLLNDDDDEDDDDNDDEEETSEVAANVLKQKSQKQPKPVNTFFYSPLQKSGKHQQQQQQRPIQQQQQNDFDDTKTVVDLSFKTNARDNIEELILRFAELKDDMKDLVNKLRISEPLLARVKSNPLFDEEDRQVVLQELNQDQHQMLQLVKSEMTEIYSNLGQLIQQKQCDYKEILDQAPHLDRSRKVFQKKLDYYFSQLNSIYQFLQQFQKTKTVNHATN